MGEQFANEEAGMAVRVVVQFEADSAERAEQRCRELTERAKTVVTEPGNLQFEVFRSVSRPDKWALIELWESQAVLDERNKARGGVPPAPEGVKRTIEHYDHHVG